MMRRARIDADFVHRDHQKRSNGTFGLGS
jgi:hypothetical protein